MLFFGPYEHEATAFIGSMRKIRGAIFSCLPLRKSDLERFSCLALS